VLYQSKVFEIPSLKFTEGFQPSSLAIFCVSEDLPEPMLPATEMKYFLLLSNDLDYSNTENLEKDISEISKMIESYINKINDN